LIFQAEVTDVDTKTKSTTTKKNASPLFRGETDFQSGGDKSCFHWLSSACAHHLTCSTAHWVFPITAGKAGLSEEVFPTSLPFKPASNIPGRQIGLLSSFVFLVTSRTPPHE